MIKLIVSDLDGTLLPRKEERLESGVFEMISKATAHGIFFAIASGRSYHELKRFFRDVERNVYFIPSDGALMVYREKSLFENEISKCFLTSFVLAARQIGSSAVVFNGKYLSYYLDADEVFAQSFHRDYHQHVLRIHSLSEIKEPIFKVSFYGVRSVELPNDLQQKFSLVYEGNNWVDFVCRNVNKSNALLVLQEQLGIATDEILAFGDNDNDVEMLKLVPNSYAMLTGSSAAIDTAKGRTNSVLDTVRNILHI